MKPRSTIDLDDPCVVQEEVDELIEEIVAVSLRDDNWSRFRAIKMVKEATDFSPDSASKIVDMAFEKWKSRR